MNFLSNSIDVISQHLILTTVATGLIIAVYHHYSKLYHYWADRGIKGPTPAPLVGNILQLLRPNRGRLENEWVKKYGKIYGIYQGSKPVLVIADPEVARKICIKDFDVFTDHEVTEFRNKYQNSFLFFLKGDRWRKVRALMSPTFTSGKLKRMFTFMDTCADDLVECIKEQLDANKSIINAKAVYSLYTMDAISTCCYGLKMAREKSATDLKTVSTRNEFVRISLKIFDFSVVRFLITMVVPKTLLLKIKFALLPQSSFEPLALRILSLIDNRRNADKKFEDYLQMLIDAKLDDQLDYSETDLKEDHHAGLSKESLLEEQKKLVERTRNSETIVGDSKLSLTDQEIISSATILMVVGLETTGNLLTSVSYALAFHPSVQERLYEEIIKIARFDELTKRYRFDYESLTSCQYLDSVVSEALRSCPPVMAVDRKALSDYYIEKYNIKLPEGAVVLLALHAMQNDPDSWDEPDRFNPNRFMPGNKEKIVPGSYCPFGQGPRHCIGMRFSLTEAKLGIAKIVANYRIEPAPGTAYPPQQKMSIGLIRFKDPVVRMVPRNQ